jgi:hypothetical protein
LTEPIGLQCHGTIGRLLGVQPACTRRRKIDVMILGHGSKLAATVGLKDVAMSRVWK